VRRPTSNDAEADVGSLADHLYEGNGVQLWTANGNTIPMCWATAGYAREKKIIVDAITRTWVATANIHVTWTDACPTTGSAQYVKVQIGRHGAVQAKDGTWYYDHSTDGQTRGAGMSTLSAPTTAPLDPQGTPGMTVWVENNGTSAQPRMEYVAVHEFGHVLGFEHEQDRPQSEPGVLDCRRAQCAGASDFNKCMADAATDENGTVLGAYDANSIMNYCNADGNNHGYLSAVDVYGVRSLYGHKPSGSITDFAGNCLDVAGGFDANATPVQMYQCLGRDALPSAGLSAVPAASQRWAFSPPTSTISWFGHARSLDVASFGTANGTKLQVWAGDGLANQAFTMPNTEIRAIGDMCIDVTSFGSANGTGLQLWHCDGLANQHFTFMSDGTIRTTDPNFPGAGDKCLDVAAFGKTNGTKVQLWTCNGLANQKWSLGANGRILPYSGTAGLCLDVGVPDVSKFTGLDGTMPLGVWACNGQENQRFALHGQIKGYGGNCVDVAGFGQANGTPAQMWSCNGLANQQFNLNW